MIGLGRLSGDVSQAPHLSILKRLRRESINSVDLVLELYQVRLQHLQSILHSDGLYSTLQRGVS
jgi:hypothetical protein